MSAKYVVDVAEYFCLGIYLVELLVLDYLIFASAPPSPSFPTFFLLRIKSLLIIILRIRRWGKEVR